MPGTIHKRVRFATRNIEYAPNAPKPSQPYTSSTSTSSGPAAPYGYIPHSSYTSHPSKVPTQTVCAHKLLGYSHHPALNFDVSLPMTSLTARSQPISGHRLEDMGVSPSMSSITLTTTFLPWSITVYASNRYYVTVRDILDTIYHFLRANVTAKEYNASHDRLQITEAYHRRYSRIKDYYVSREEKNSGVKRVDFLQGRTRFTGITPTSRIHVWELHLS